jgi:monothiol glutaredoxin
MNRPILTQENIAPEALNLISNYHEKTIQEVENAIKTHKVVIVGMAHNPFVSKVRKALTKAGVSFEYLEYGSYFSSWKPRLAIKLWSGWPTYPQVFVNGKLIGGFQETEAAIKNGNILS